MNVYIIKSNKLPRRKQRGIASHSGTELARLAAKNRNLVEFLLDPGSESGMTRRRKRRSIIPMLRTRHRF